jgi:hypothetical protein
MARALGSLRTPMLTSARLSAPRVIGSLFGLLIFCAVMVAERPSKLGDSASDPSDVAGFVFAGDEVAPSLPQGPVFVPTACLARAYLEPLCPTGRLVAPELFRPPTSLAA